MSDPAARRLEHHLRHCPLGVIEWNLDFECASWNPAATAIFGHAEAEALGRHAVGLILRDGDRADIMRGWRRLLLQKTPTSRVNENITREGQVILCEWWNAPLEGADGGVVGVCSWVRDITEEARSHDTMRRVHAVLERRALDAEEDAREKEHLARRLAQELERSERHQRDLLALSTPILEVGDGLLALPLVGRVDALRGAQALERVIPAVAARRARHVLIDFTGAELFDAEAVRWLDQLLRALSLLGARGLVTGLRPSAARALVDAGMDLATFEVHRSLREGIEACAAPAQRARGSPIERRASGR